MPRVASTARNEDDINTDSEEDLLGEVSEGTASCDRRQKRSREEPEGLSAGEQRLLDAMTSNTRKLLNTQLNPLNAKVDQVSLKTDQTETEMKKMNVEFNRMKGRLTCLESGRPGGGTGTVGGNCSRFANPHQPILKQPL